LRAEPRASRSRCGAVR
jgi:hypothetical protein